MKYDINPQAMQRIMIGTSFPRRWIGRTGGSADQLMRSANQLAESHLRGQICWAYRGAIVITIDSVLACIIIGTLHRELTDFLVTIFKVFQRDKEENLHSGLKWSIHVTYFRCICCEECAVSIATFWQVSDLR